MIWPSTWNTAPKWDMETRKEMFSALLNAKKRGVLHSSRISGGWWRHFLECQADLSLRQGDSTGHVRMNAMSKDMIDHYFGLLSDHIYFASLLLRLEQIRQSQFAHYCHDFTIINTEVYGNIMRVRKPLDSTFTIFVCAFSAWIADLKFYLTTKHY